MSRSGGGCIRGTRSARTQVVAAVAREQHYWLIEPLLRAGMDPEEIRKRLTRLTFDCMVRPGDQVASTPVDDQPPEIRAAWAEMIERMLALGEPAQGC